MSEVAHNLSKKQVVTETWLPISGYEGLYEVSNYGRIRCIKGGNFRLLHPRSARGNYLIVNFSKHSLVKTMTVHRVVASTFIPNPESLPEIDHIDSNRQNNHVSNLRWVTHQENISHAGELGHMARTALQHGKWNTSKRGGKRSGRISREKQTFDMDNTIIESKTFKEIWSTLNGEERNELARRLYLARCCSTYQTLWNWGTGKTQPSSPLVRDKVASIISKLFGLRISGTVLFPNSSR